MSEELSHLPIFKATSEPWMAYRACAGVPVEVFFPTRGEDVRRAKTICGTCTVAMSCLDYALRVGEKNGVWGGKSERERRRLRRERKVSKVKGD